MKAIELGIGNYYGKVIAYEENGKYYIEIEDYDGAESKEISEEFYRAIEKEFKRKEG